jgi:hypothetical protein
VPSRSRSAASIERGPKPGGEIDVRQEAARAVAAQHRDRVVAQVGGGDVERAVGVEVGRHERGRPEPDRVQHRRVEAAVAVAAQQRDGVRRDEGDRVHDGEVERAVLVEVRGRDVERPVARRVRAGRDEAAVAEAEQDRDRPRPLRDDRDRVDDRQVGHAVAVEVADGDRLRVRAGGHEEGRGEAAVAVPEQHGGRAGAAGSAQAVLVDGDDVDGAVAVEVGGRDRVGLGADRQRRQRLEAAVLALPQHGQRGALVVRDDEVAPAVAVEVGRGDRDGRAARVEGRAVVDVGELGRLGLRPAGRRDRPGERSSARRRGPRCPPRPRARRRAAPRR